MRLRFVRFKKQLPHFAAAESCRKTKLKHKRDINFNMLLVTRD